MPHSHAAAAKAVELVRSGRAELLMKGSLHTDELMREIVAKERGLRTERRISHVFVMDVPSYPEPLFITDAAVNIFPDLETKADICRNAIDLHLGLGLGTPRVAILSAIETGYPDKALAKYTGSSSALAVPAASQKQTTRSGESSSALVPRSEVEVFEQPAAARARTASAAARRRRIT